MNVATTSRPKAHGWIAGAALVWNLLGLVMLAFQLSMGPAQVAALSAPERAVYESTPAWLNVAFGIAVGSGVLGSIGLWLRRRWAVASFAVSLVAMLIQFSGAYLATPAWQAYGVAGVVMPVLLLTIGGWLLRYARRVTA